MPKSIRYGLIVVFTVIASWLAYQMSILPLWGYLPLFFFLSLAIAVVLLFFNKYSNHPKANRLLALSGLSSLCLYFGFPTMPLTPLMFVGFVPLLIIEDELFNWRGSTSKWILFKYSFTAFLFWNILSTFWVANTSFGPSFAAFILNSIFMTVPLLLYHQLRKKMGDRYRFIALICFWISFEYGHMAWEISWPWLTLGNAFAQYPSWIQWYEFTGHLGGSFWILTANVLAYLTYQAYIKKESLQLRKRGIQFLTWSILPILFSIFLYYKYEEKGTPVEVAVIQGNYEPHYQKFNSAQFPRELQFNNFLEQSNRILTDSTEYLVFPETSFWYFRMEDLLDYPRIQRLKEFIDEYDDLKLVTGLITRQDLDPQSKLPSWARESKTQGGTIYWELQNSAVQLKSGDSEVQTHIKSKLVPGPEIFPYSRFLFFLKPIIQTAGGTLEGHARRKERSVLTDGDKKIAPVICYESIYGEYVGEYIRKGAQAIFIITNDGWWDNTPGHLQHLKFAQLRAIEHRRSIARSANTGISCFINQRGDISQATKYETAAEIREEIHFNKSITFYSKWGDLIARLAILGTIVLLLSMLVKRFR